MNRDALATCRCRGPDTLVAVDGLVNPDSELGEVLQPAGHVPPLDVPKLEILERIRCALEEVSEQRFHTINDGGDGRRVPGVFCAANRHVHRSRVGDHPDQWRFAWSVRRDVRDADGAAFRATRSRAQLRRDDPRWSSEFERE